MGFLGDLLSGGVAGLLKSAGGFANDIRTVITGEATLTSEGKALIEGKLIDLEALLSQIGIETDKLRHDIIVAEAKSQSALARNWRPILMLVIIVIVANNYIFFPYASLFTTKVAILELPEHLWSLLQIGVGGYIVSRGAEKVAQTLRK